MNLLTRLEKRSQIFWVIVILAFVVLIGVLDVLTGYELYLSLFYLLPISVASWFVGRRSGVVTSIVCAFIWFTSDVISGHTYSHPAIIYWNTAIRFGFFFITAILLSALNKALEHEQKLARTDNLTGAINRNFFSELVQMEIYRSQRFGHPFTLAYVDLDNFKAVNDNLGHHAGDNVLCTIVNHARSQCQYPLFFYLDV